MSGNRWDQAGVPHKGWHCVDVVDLRADGEPADDTDYATCQMCGNEKIRYVHIMEHPDVEESLDVGYGRAANRTDASGGPKRQNACFRDYASDQTCRRGCQWQIPNKGISILMARCGARVNLCARGDDRRWKLNFRRPHSVLIHRQNGAQPGNGGARCPLFSLVEAEVIQLSDCSSR